MKTTKQILAILLTIAIAACGGGGGSGGGDTTAPMVSSTSPADGTTGVAQNAVVTATFSEAMTASTLDSTTFTLSNGATCTVTYSGTTATCTPTANLTASTPYTASISTGAKDAANNALAASYTWTFITGGGVATTVLTGISASGNPVANGVGYALDAVTGTKLSFTTDANGNFSKDITTYAGPFLVRVTGQTTGGSQSDSYSIITKAQLATPLNVTPLSNLVLASAADVLPQDLESRCTSNQTACPALLTNIIANLGVANTAVANALGPVLTQFGVTPGTFDAFTTPFTPGSHSGVDAVLDAIQITPPINGATDYKVTLANGTQTAIATVTLGSGGSVTAALPSATALMQAQNLTVALGEIQTRITDLSNLFATSLPTTGEITPFIDSSMLFNGNDAAMIIATLTSGNAIAIGQVITGGTLAPYAGGNVSGSTPGANVTFDANNCAVEVWVMLFDGSFLFKDAIPTFNAPGTCTGGTWTMAGNRQQYVTEPSLGFGKQDLGNGAAVSYITTLAFGTVSSQTIANSNAVNPFTSVTVSSLGLVTYGNRTTPAPVVIAPNLNFPSWTQNPISDSYYNGMEAIVSCDAIDSVSVPYGVGKWVQPSSSTPCFNSDLVAGSDLTFRFYNGTQLLQTYMSRIHVTPSAVSVPTSWYPTITSISPTSAATFTANVARSITVNWTLPTGGIYEGGWVELQDANNANLLPSGANLIAASNATSATTSVTPTGNAVRGGLASGGTGSQFSAVGVSVTVGGITLFTQTFF